MMTTSRLSLSVMLAAALVVSSSQAFVAPSGPVASSSTTALFASRRNVLYTAFGAALAFASTTPEPASATYTGYTQREQDWEQRQKEGSVTFSNAKALRAQLKDIVPQNSEGSKIFCPNGLSSSVSPLQENKCGDRMAMPSVYGRTEDVVGNSIPGFKGGRYPPTSTGQLLSTDVGGFPSYK